MTAALRHLFSTSLKRIVLALVVCVPVPAIALSGLAVPLPSVVERAAAALVPWADAATLDTQALAASMTRGSIVPGAVGEVDRTVEERRTDRRVLRPRASHVVVTSSGRTSSAPRVDDAEPETRRTPAAPSEPHADEGDFESPLPAPGEPELADETTDSAPAEPHMPPADEPDPDPKDRVDAKPVDDADVAPVTPPTPADENDVEPTDPDTKPPDEKPVDPELAPEEKPDPEKVDASRDTAPGNSRSNAAGPGT